MQQAWYLEHAALCPAYRNTETTYYPTGADFFPVFLRELAQADREGISPCTFCRFNPPSSGDGKPCCMCPAEAALRRKQDG